MARKQVDPERRAFVVENLRSFKESHGSLPESVVRPAAERLGVSSRTLYRWVAEPDQPSKRRGAWLPGEDEIALYFAARGNVEQVRRMIVGDGGAPPAVDTMRRGFKRALNTAERAYAVEGTEGFRKHSLYLRIDPEHRNDQWQMDHYEIPVWVHVARRSGVHKAWLTMLIDAAARAIMGWSVSLQPSSDEVLAALRAAIVVKEHRGPFGGVPEMILWDNGGDFLSDAVTDSVAELGVYCAPTAAYSPHQKGKIERLFSTFESEFCKHQPFYTDGPRSASGKLLGKKDATLSLEELVAGVENWVNAYNNERVHSAISMTPRERWDADPKPLRLIPEDRLRHLLRARDTRVVGKSGIRYANTDYFAPELQGLGGESVEIRFERNDPRKIWVYRDSQFLCEAVPQADLDEETRRLHLGKRRLAHQRASQLRRKGDRRARAGRIKAMTEPGVVEDTVAPVVPGTKQKRRQMSEIELLHELGIEGVNTVVKQEDH